MYNIRSMDPFVQPLNTQPQDLSTKQILKLRQKVESALLPDDLKQNLLERIEHLDLMKSASGLLASSYMLEYEHASTYINWITQLPWNTKTQDVLDLERAKTVLDKNHFGLQDVKDRILEYLASIILNFKNNQVSQAPILCLVGLAGTGKTTLAISIAESLGRSFQRIPFGGMGDARQLRGQSRALPDAEPGYIIKKLIASKSKNPVVLLDELDRVSESARADIMGVLIELLDPEQHKAFIDHYLDYPFDLSEIIFVSTANSTSHVATAVLDRLEIIQMPSYTDHEKLIIAKDYVFPKIRKANGLSDAQLRIDESLWPQVIRPLGFDSGIRSLERTIEGMCRKAAREIVEGKAQAVQVNGTNIKNYLPHF